MTLWKIQLVREIFVRVFYYFLDVQIVSFWCENKLLFHAPEAYRGAHE